ncbi:MerR family DNA-binding transcriptional regulator [Endozoicomonas sp. GU-1]|uniref:MerR family DNA-binding transcriptional regulator n=1 Tax=Endozoicomonas sp. GU-1 TaxID=3009078 RepID=UPI0022B3528B|nr:MerR family DNA-binding transcriptional regulator [Endozoicomonas sp. GU-1]WBA83375.1 MerR family transcriptional regulator [Endozoicomonas sp. GU-1]WBA86307.1 MerR family transcriptional regulator [Endozoicomonas sp. GU-1]
MNDRYSISRAADHLGVSPPTLRRWEACGKLVPELTAGGQRRYSASQLMTQQTPQVQRKTVAYSRVSSHDQKKDLAKDVLEIIAVFSARLYGSRKNQQLMEKLTKVVEDAG